MTKRIRKWPHKVRKGNVVVTIYKTFRKSGPKTKEGILYAISWKNTEGRWVQRQRADLGRALEEADEIAENLHEGKQDATSFTRTELEGIAHAQQIAGKTPLLSIVKEWRKAQELTDGQVIPAARAWQAQHRSKVKKMTVSKVIEVFLKAKVQEGIDIKASYLRTMPSVEKAMGKVQIASITPTRIQDWLNQYKNGRTRNTHRKRIVSMFRWAARRGYLPVNLKSAAELTDSAKEAAVDIGIVDSQTYFELLNYMRKNHPQYLAAVVLAGLCGMRRGEVHGQLWKDIHLDRKFVRVSAVKPGTPAKRLVTLHDTAIEWLLLCPNRTGEVCPGTTLVLDRVRFIGKKQGMDLPKNCFRDSYISFRIAATGEIDRTAMEAGTSAKMIHQHYKELVTREEGEDWLNNRPIDESGKVVSFAKG